MSGRGGDPKEKYFRELHPRILPWVSTPPARASFRRGGQGRQVCRRDTAKTGFLLRSAELAC